MLQGPTRWGSGPAPVSVAATLTTAGPGRSVEGRGRGRGGRGRRGAAQRGAGGARGGGGEECGERPPPRCGKGGGSAVPSPNGHGCCGAWPIGTASDAVSAAHGGAGASAP